MKVVALQTWANGSLTMEEKQVADIPDDLAAYLIERGIVAESPEYYGGGSNSLIVELTQTSETGGTTSKTAQEMTDAYNSGKEIVFRILRYPTEQDHRDVKVTNVQYTHTNGMCRFNAWVFDGNTAAIIETSGLNPTDAIFYLTVLLQ